MSKKLYWMGPGVVCVGKKEYGADMPLPISKIDKNLLEKWEENGRVGEKIAVIVKDSRDDKIKELEENTKGLIDHVGKLEGSLEDARNHLTELSGVKNQLDESLEDVKTLNIVKEEFDVLKAKVLALKGESKEVKQLKEEVTSHG